MATIYLCRRRLALDEQSKPKNKGRKHVYFVLFNDRPDKLKDRPIIKTYGTLGDPDHPGYAEVAEIGMAHHYRKIAGSFLCSGDPTIEPILDQIFADAQKIDPTTGLEKEKSQRDTPTRHVKYKTEIEGHVRKRVPVIPEGFSLLDCYIPHSTPWDYHGNKHADEIVRAVMFFAPAIKSCHIFWCHEHHAHLHPHGTGPGGRVRLGDDMMPGIYRVYVATPHLIAAQKALLQQRQAINDWLNNDGEKPRFVR